MKDYAVVVTFLGQQAKILGRLGRVLFEQLELDRAFIGLNNRSPVCHSVLISPLRCNCWISSISLTANHTKVHAANLFEYFFAQYMKCFAIIPIRPSRKGRWSPRPRDIHQSG